MHQYRLRERLDHGTPARPWHLYTLGSSRGTVFPCHWHPEWELVVVERGTLELTRNQELVRLGTGDVAFVTGTDLHGGEGRDLEVAAFVFHPGILKSERRDAATSQWIDPLETGALRVPGILRAADAPAALAHRLVDLVRAAPPGMELELRGLLFQFLSALVTADRVQPSEEATTFDPLPRLRASLQFIEEEFAQPLSVEFLARRANLSPSHFARLFKAFTGDTPIQHLIRRRIDEAARLLGQGGLSVAEVALQVGFTNFSHFSRTYRALRGLAPSEESRGIVRTITQAPHGHQPPAPERRNTPV